MACIDRVPKCGLGDSPDPVASPLKQIGGIAGVIGTIISVLGGLGVLKDVAAFLGGASAGGAIASLLGVLAVIGIIAVYAFNRCIEGDGRPQCIAGCVSNIQESFSQTSEVIFPFTAMHNRVDVTVKSFFWDFLELSNAFVYCTNDPYPRASEIMHCYYYTKRVCNAETGALYGAAIGGIGGIIAGAAVAAAIGCATVILCIFALILAALIAIAAALVGAFAGGNIVQAATGDNQPTDNTGAVISIGNLVTINGNMKQLEEDNKANVLWWADSTSIHGQISPSTAQPFSYCDIDEQLTMDACPRAQDVIK